MGEFGTEGERVCIRAHEDGTGFVWMGFGWVSSALKYAWCLVVGLGRCEGDLVRLIFVVSWYLVLVTCVCEVGGRGVFVCPARGVQSIHPVQ